MSKRTKRSDFDFSSEKSGTRKRKREEFVEQERFRHAEDEEYGLMDEEMNEDLLRRKYVVR